MQTKKIVYGALVALLLVTGCGKSSSTASEDDTGLTTSIVDEGNYAHQVINNRGESVESKIGAYEVRLYSDHVEGADDMSPHKGIVVKLNGKDSKLMPIQATYLHQDIVAKVYEEGKFIAQTEAIEVTDNEPVVLIDVAI